ncbi:hypothetical protein AB4124_04780 [Paenibacillus sp. 2KB_20]|uniref:hypothetical protein n=1 Tax=Paenibacillus sp. 2KB_20 TaxID=3232977 RepID=UPI003F985323
MTNYLVNNRSKFYIYSSKGLFQLALKPELHDKVKAMMGSLDSAIIEVSDTIVDKLTRNINVASNQVSMETAAAALRMDQEEALQFICLGTGKGLIANHLSPLNQKELKANLLAEQADPILELYVHHLMIRNEDKLQSFTPKRIFVDLQRSHITREIKLLSDFPLWETDLSEIKISDQQDPLQQLTRLEQLENNLLHEFIVRDQIWDQIPYKVSVSQDGTYFVGRSQIEQIIHCSYANLEHIMAGLYSDGSWVVAEDMRQLVNKCTRLLFEPAFDPKIKRYSLSYCKIRPAASTSVTKMIDQFVPERERQQLRVEIQQNTELHVYAVTAFQSDRPCTQTIYGGDVEVLVHDVLQHYFAINYQNKIKISGHIADDDVVPLPEVFIDLPKAQAELVLQAIQTRFQVYEMSAETLANLHVLYLKKREV